MSRHMSRQHFIALVLALAIYGDPVLADLRGLPDGAPVFSAAEQQIIARNVALATLVGSDPWTVRRFLDVLAARSAADTRDAPVAGLAPGAKPAVPARPGKATPGKGSANPDVDDLERSSPEAVHDLFQRLKQAGTAQPKN